MLTYDLTARGRKTMYEYLYEKNKNNHYAVYNSFYVRRL